MRIASLTLFKTTAHIPGINGLNKSQFLLSLILFKLRRLRRTSNSIMQTYLCLEFDCWELPTRLEQSVDTKHELRHNWSNNPDNCRSVMQTQWCLPSLEDSKTPKLPGDHNKRVVNWSGAGVNIGTRVMPCTVRKTSIHRSLFGTWQYLLLKNDENNIYLTPYFWLFWRGP